VQTLGLTLGTTQVLGTVQTLGLTLGTTQVLGTTQLVAGINSHTLSFGSGGSISGSVFVNGDSLLAIASPGTWTAALLGFEVTADAATPGAGSWYRLYSPSGQVTAALATAGTSIYYLNVSQTPGVFWVRGFSGGAGVGTNQAADRTLTLLTRQV
jgi:hypothetical protein